MGSHIQRRSIALGSSKAVAFTSHGAIAKVLKVHTYELPELLPENIMLKMMAAPINPSDINVIEGTYPVKPEFRDFGAIPGNEGVGQIIAIGNKVENFRIGDWVIPCNSGFGTWQTMVVTDAEHIQKLPDCTAISPILAATISINPLTAYRMLKDFVSLKPGDVIMQNSSNSAVGQAVIQLAHAWGFKTVNVVRNKFPVNLLRPDIEDLRTKLHRLGADMVVTENEIRDAKVAAQIARLGPARLALNGVGGKSATNIARLLVDNGVIVTYGGMSREPVIIPTSLYIFKNLQSRGFWLNKWKILNPVSAQIEMISEIFALAKNGGFVEPFHKTINLNDASFEQILNFVQKSGTAQKHVFVCS